MLAGLTSAYGEGHPVIAIACSRRTAVNYPDRGGAWQATDLVTMAKPITKYSAIIPRSGSGTGNGARGLSSCHHGPPWASAAGHSRRNACDESRYRQAPHHTGRQKPRAQPGRGRPLADRKAAELLANAKHPFIYAGKGTLWAGASQELVALGDYLAAGMGSSVGGGVIPEDHPHYFHLFDMQTTALVRNEADVVLVIGGGWASTTAGACHRPGAIRHVKKQSRSTRTLFHRREPACRSGHRSRRQSRACGAAIGSPKQSWTS